MKTKPIDASSAIPIAMPSSRRARRVRRLIIVAGLAMILVLINVLPALAATATLVRAPYVQQVAPTSLIVVWTTTEDGPSEVRYGTSSYDNTAVATSTLFSTTDSAPYNAYYVHEAILTGLTPDTLYKYKIYTNGIDITPGGSITVRSGKPANVTSFRFAALGDSGQGNQAQKDVAARLLQIQPDLVLHTGDIVYGKATYKNYETRYFQIYDDLIQSVWFAPSAGNHDTDFNDGKSFVDVYVNPTNGASDPIEREMYYSFDYANAHFAVVTSELPYRKGSAQYNWLDNDLANTNQFWKFVVFHVPPFYTSDTQEFRKNGQPASDLVPLFEKHDVDMVMSGDIHYYERFVPLKGATYTPVEAGGIVYVITGGGGAGLRGTGNPPWNALTGGKAQLYHLTMFEVDGCQLELSAVVRSENGDPFDSSDIFDSFILDRCEGPPVADFTADVVTGPAPHTVNFTDLSRRGPTSWNWNFGDGQSATSRHPSHTYTTPGTYSVTLTVGNSMGSDTLTMTDYVVVTDPPPPMAHFAETAYEVNESGGPTVPVEVVLTRPSSSTISVNYATANDTAVAPSDFVAASGTLTFAPGQTSKTFNVTIVDDAEAEPTQSFNLTLSGAAVTDPRTATLSILDDDTPPVVRFSQEEFNVGEGDATAELQVELSYAFRSQITVNVSTANATAQSGQDYTAVSQTLTFAPGETRKTLSVPLLNDALDEFTESFTVQLSNPTVATLGTPRTVTVQISDDDPTPQLTFANAAPTVSETAAGVDLTILLSAVSAKTVTVTVASADATAVAGADYTAVSSSLTFLPGETSKTVTVPILNDALDETDETAVIELKQPENASAGDPATLTITDDDAPPQVRFAAATYSVNENGGGVDLVVALSTASGQSVSVDYGITGGTAVAGDDYKALGGTLTLAPGETSGVITFSAINDSASEGSETAVVALSAPLNAVLGAPDAATVTIVDDDAPPEVQFSAAAATVDEADGTVAVTVTLIGVTNKTVAVDYATSDGTAVAGSDYTAVAGTLTFAPGTTAHTIELQLHDDSLSEDTETVLLTLANPVNGVLGTPAQVELSIVDNDGAPAVTAAVAALTAAEEVGTVEVVVTLSAPAGRPVTVDYVVSGGTAVAGVDYVAGSGTLTFAPGDTRKTITVQILDDALPEPGETVIVTLDNVTNATLGAPDSVTITILDQDSHMIFMPLIQ